MHLKYKGISLVRYFLIRHFLKANKITYSPFSKNSVIWGARNERQVGDVVIEDGFIRSNGLGVNYAMPYSLVFDDVGIYFDATKPSKLENLLNSRYISKELIVRSRCIIESLIKNRLTKYNVGDFESLEVPADKMKILVPGQVDGDASIRFGSPEIKSSIGLLKQVRLEYPDAYIIFKPHPDVVSGHREIEGSIEDFYKIADDVVPNISITHLFEVADEVHTLTSLSGFEALLRGKRVVTYGLPFYAGWGLTVDKLSCSRRSRKVTIEELVACSLILYPTYLNPTTGLEITIEETIEAISKEDSNNEKLRLYLRVLLLLRKLRSRIIRH
ncbi:hypothetical protein A1OW_09850 [Enterovibrio norvegicus]|nr:hypothetical protein A1OW_09850 [Enterovibrio norvegicus]